MHSLVMEINGLPLHPLAVHGAVVLTPLAALLALAYVVPKWRDALRWPVVVAVLVALGAVWVAFLSGSDFRDSDRFATATGEFADKLQTHEDLGSLLRWVASGFVVVALVATGLHKKPGLPTVLVSALLVVASIATIVLTVMTGDAGSQAVWGT
jgi:uncharacterized membrane protein